MFQFIQQLKDLKSRTDLSKKEAAELMAQIELPNWLAAISSQMGWFVIGSIWLGSIFLALLFLNLVHSIISDFNSTLQTLCYAFSGLIFLTSFILIAGFFAQIGRMAILPGKYPRRVNHPIYALRRIYGTAWTQIYYFKPLYAIILAIPFLKKLVFKLFGYKGNSTDFTVYPDSWIRDLPLLKIGQGVYLANRCTIGTNICLNDSSIIVGECVFEDNSMVGHLSIFGLDCKLGLKSELGVNTAMGIRVSIGSNTHVGPKCSFYHGSNVGDNVTLGSCSILGLKSKVGNNINLKFGTIVPSGLEITNQSEADKLFNYETSQLYELKNNIENKIIEILT